MRATQIQSGGLSILTDHLIVFIAFANPICSNYSFLQLGSSTPQCMCHLLAGTNFMYVRKSMCHTNNLNLEHQATLKIYYNQVSFIYNLVLF